MTIQFRFNLQKAIETTSLILSYIDEERISAWKLLRYIYAIDRYALRDLNYPIIGGVNILRGTPINEDLYKVLFWYHKVPEYVAKNQEIWDKYYLVNRGKQVIVVKSRDNIVYDGDLNENECRLIRSFCNSVKYLELDEDYPEIQLVEMNYQTLDNVGLLKIFGRTDEEIEEIRLVSLRVNYLSKKLEQ